MHRSYDDITGRLGAPEWWEGGGVPRYCTFRPKRLGVYDTYACYFEIACQACEMRFEVAVGVSDSWHRMRMDDAPVLPSQENGIGSFHYGDPPQHGCSSGAGETMNSIPIRVMEFWRRDGDNHDWRRDSKHEVEWGDPQDDISDADRILGAASDASGDRPEGDGE